MINPAERISIDNVAIAVRAALTCAERLNLRTIAFPGMGTGVGGVNKDNATRIMIKE